MSDNPHPILPWHREAAKEIEANHVWGRMEPQRIKDRAAIIARQDPHQETLRLLERAAHFLVVGESSDAAKLSLEIRAHLAAQKGTT